MNVNINSELHDTKQQTVTFSDQNQQWVNEININQDDAFGAADKSDALLEDFFKRPIRVLTMDWNVGSQLAFTTINPWQAFFENTRIINRISNFKNLRCDLKAKIVINGNGFHYGRALVSYRPLMAYDEFPVWRDLVTNSRVPASQRQHVWLDPTKSQGGTLHMPFVWIQNALSIPEQDWREMGEIDIGSITPLLHANNGNDQVAITVFVWAENVTLSMPTASEPGALSPQGGEMDEYVGSGTISGPANAIAKAAGALEKVPVIAPYATATKAAATVASKVAGALGLSRPVDNSGIASYKPSYVGNMANTNVIDTSTKLTYDVKQELTIDPSAVGLGNDDEMDISAIAQRESYLTQFNWDRTDNADDILWSCYVTPMLFASAGSTPNEYFLTPMGYAAMPFTQWRGTIRYRFQIIASQFHKGRIKVVYDPHFNLTSEYNIQYTQVIDLANARDFTVDIGWGQPFSFLNVPTLDDTVAWYDNGELTGSRTGDTNGTISVYSVNSLTSPSDGSDTVQVLVSVSAGPDFEVVNPSDFNLKNTTFYAPESGEVTAFNGVAGYNPSASAEDPQWFSRLPTSSSDYIAMQATPGSNNLIRYLPSGKELAWPLDELEEQFGELPKRCDCGSELSKFGEVDVCWKCYKCYVDNDMESLTPQAGELDNPETDLTANETAPVSLDTKVSMGALQKVDHTYLTYFGDPISNLRCLFKRYNPHTSWAYEGDPTVAGGVRSHTVSDFPFNRGYAGIEAMHNAFLPVDPTPYNYSRMTCMNWFTPAFLTRRGGIRWKYIWNKESGEVYNSMSVSRSGRTSALTSTLEDTFVGTKKSNLVKSANGLLAEDTVAGCHVTHVQQNPVLEVELPFHSKYRFVPGRKRGWKLGNPFLYQHTLKIPGGTEQTAKTCVNAYCAAGEDFSLASFQAVPSFWLGEDPQASQVD